MKEKLERVIAALEVEAAMIESHAQRLLEMVPSVAGMNNDTKCCSWRRKRRKGPKQSRGKFACYEITSEAGRFQGHVRRLGPMHDDTPELG
jgi:hypothetical protein